MKRKKKKKTQFLRFQGQLRLQDGKEEEGGKSPNYARILNRRFSGHPDSRGKQNRAKQKMTKQATYKEISIWVASGFSLAKIHMPADSRVNPKFE